MPCGRVGDGTGGLRQFNIVAGNIVKRRRLMYSILAVAEPRPLNCADEDAAVVSQLDSGSVVWGVRQRQDRGLRYDRI